MNNIDIILLILSLTTSICFLYFKKFGLAKITIFLFFLHIAYIGLETLFINQIFIFNRPKINLFAQILIILFTILITTKRQLLFLALTSLLALIFFRIYQIQEYEYFFSIYVYVFTIGYILKNLLKPIFSHSRIRNWLLVLVIFSFIGNTITKSTFAQNENILENDIQHQNASATITIDDNRILDSLVKTFITDLGLDKNLYNIYNETNDSDEIIQQLYPGLLYAINDDTVFVFCNQKVKIFQHSCQYDQIQFDQNDKVKNLDKNIKIKVDVGQLQIGDKKVYFIPMESIFNYNEYSDLIKLLSNQHEIVNARPIKIINHIDKKFFYTLSFALWGLIIFETLVLNSMSITNILRDKRVIGLIILIPTISIFTLFFYYQYTSYHSIKNNLLTDFRQDKNYFHDNYLIYSPTYNHLINRNYKQFSSNRNLNYLVSAKDAKTLAELVLKTDDIKKILTSQQTSNYIYIPYHESNLSRIIVHQKCMDKNFPNQILESNKEYEIGINLYYIDEFEEISTNKKSLFRHPRCKITGQHNALVMDTANLNIQVNNEGGNLIKFNNISADTIDKIELYDTNNVSIPFSYISDITGSKSFKNISTSDPILINFSVIANEIEFNISNSPIQSQLQNFIDQIKQMKFSLNQP